MVGETVCLARWLVHPATRRAEATTAFAHKETRFIASFDALVAGKVPDVSVSHPSVARKLLEAVLTANGVAIGQRIAN